MSKNKTWKTPGWPWEMDLLSFIFVLLALAVPYYLFSDYHGDAVARTLKEQQHVLWAIGIAVLFVMHLAVAGATIETISTPFLYILSPIVFAVLAYYRTYAVLLDTGQKGILTGSVLQYALLAGGVFLITLLIARIRMARLMLRYRNVQWDISGKSRYDRTFWELIAEVQPLFYPPRVVRACSEGVLVEGWFYFMALPFEMFQGLAPASGIRHSSNGRYIASNTRSLVRLELLDNAEPLYISPENRAEFIAYCAQHIAHLRPHALHTQADNRHGKNHGTAHDAPHATTHGTAHGTARGTAHGTKRASFYTHDAKEK